MNALALGLLYLLLLMGFFLVLPVWVIVRVKLPLLSKILFGFNYFALIAVISMHLGAIGSLFRANRAAREDLHVLIRELRSRPAAEIVPVLDERLSAEAGGGVPFSERFPDPEGEKNDRKTLPPPEPPEVQCPARSVMGLPGCGPR